MYVCILLPSSASSEFTSIASSSLCQVDHIVYFLLQRGQPDRKRLRDRNEKQVKAKYLEKEDISYINQ